jgi:acyl-CoA synthetase (AMP-forming)/AMP-acid ligase II
MGKSLLNTHVAAAGSVVINNTFAYPATVLQEMAREGVTGFSGVPSTYAFLLHRSPLREYLDRLPALRYCAQAGGHMARHVKQQLRDALPAHTDIVVMYGATEAAARLTYLDPRRFADKCDSIGLPIPGVTMRVLDAAGNELPPGETGELVASGENIMRGYWQDPEGTARVLDAHGYHTGDQGYRDAEGFFYVTGRADRLIKVGGHRVNPQEVEDALLATDLVVEAAVMGLPDPLQGNQLAAVAVPNAGDLTTERILGACAQTLPRHKLPARLELVRALPKNASGKIDLEACRALLGG